VTTKNKKRVKRPALKLTGVDGNAFVILGLARSVGKKAGWSEAELDAMSDEAMTGDYDHLLWVVQKHFKVS